MSRRGVVARAAAAVAVALACIAVGLVVGRITAPDPTIVVTSAPVTEEAPVEALALVDMSTSVAPTAITATWPLEFASAPGLPDEPGVAVGYRLTRTGMNGSDFTLALARAFGITGSVVETAAGWTAASTDDSGGRVVVLDDRALTWTMTSANATAAAGQPVPRAGAARTIASDLLASIGIRSDVIDWQVLREADSVRVIGWQLVDGQRTSLAWSVTLGPAGSVLAASGMGAALDLRTTYPVVGAASAVERAGLPLWSSLGPVRVPVPDDEATASTSPVTPAAAAPAGSLLVDSTSVTFVAADLGLAQYRQPDGSVMVLPAYRLTAEDGSQWTVLAIASDHVRFVPAPLPQASGSAATVLP